MSGFEATGQGGYEWHDAGYCVVEPGGCVLTVRVYEPDECETVGVCRSDYAAAEWFCGWCFAAAYEYARLVAGDCAP